MSFAERSKIVNHFRTDPSSPRVLIFSAVGTVGLNLAMADSVILLESVLSLTSNGKLIVPTGSALERSRRTADHRPRVAPTSIKNCLRLLSTGIGHNGCPDVTHGAWQSIVIGSFCRKIKYVAFHQFILL
jgi:hypothetical protein